MYTQNKYNSLKLPLRRLHIRIELINERDVVVGSLEGVAIDGNISLDSDSTYRRSGSLSMILDKKYNVLPNPSSKIWFNKRCNISIGLSNFNDSINWFNLGRFAIDEVDLNYSKSEKTMSCQLKDYMAFLDGTLGGYTTHKTLIKAGEVTIAEAIRATVAHLGKISIENIGIKDYSALVPYDIEKSPNTTVYEIVDELVNMYMGYDFYFDENGYFIVEKIKDKKNDPVIEVFDGEDKDFTLDTNPKIDFKNVKNNIQIWGRQFEDGSQIKWGYKNRCARNDKTELNTIMGLKTGDICHIYSENNSYVWNGETWELLDFKVVPIFNVENIGEKPFAYSDDNIFTEEQAKLRAEYELQQKSNLAETVRFSCVPLYHLNVNHKIEINIDNEIKGDYIIKSIDIPLDISSPMSISANKIYY